MGIETLGSSVLLHCVAADAFNTHNEEALSLLRIDVYVVSYVSFSDEIPPTQLADFECVVKFHATPGISMDSKVAPVERKAT